jgi:hypothetical protein
MTGDRGCATGPSTHRTTMWAILTSGCREFSRDLLRQPPLRGLWMGVEWQFATRASETLPSAPSLVSAASGPAFLMLGTAGSSDSPSGL